MTVTVAVTVTGGGANTSVNVNYNPNGTVDVTVGKYGGVGVTVSPITPPVTTGIATFTAYSGSAQTHGVTISANVGVTVVNVPPPYSGGPAWLNDIGWGLGIFGAFALVGGFAAPWIVAGGFGWATT